MAFKFGELTSQESLSTGKQQIKVTGGNSFGPIHFGASSEAIQKALESSYKLKGSFMKTKSSKDPTLDYGGFHVFFNNDKCVAVEMFDDSPLIPVVNGIPMFPCQLTDLVAKFIKMSADSWNFVIGGGGFVSRERSVGIWIDESRVASVLVGAPGYYGRDGAKKAGAASEALEGFAPGEGGVTEFRLARKAVVFGKPVRAIVTFHLNEDGTFDPRVCEAYNKFFCKLGDVIKAKTKMILTAVNQDNDQADSKPVTEADLAKNFAGVQDCFVQITRDPIDCMDESGKAVRLPSGTDHVLAHCSLEWKYDGKSDNNDFRFDAEHGNGFAMVDGKFYMGKPGDFY